MPSSRNVHVHCHMVRTSDIHITPRTFQFAPSTFNFPPSILNLPPSTFHPALRTLHSAPGTSHLSPCILHRTSCMLFISPCDAACARIRTHCVFTTYRFILSQVLNDCGCRDTVRVFSVTGSRLKFHRFTPHRVPCFRLIILQHNDSCVHCSV